MRQAGCGKQPPGRRDTVWEDRVEGKHIMTQAQLVITSVSVRPYESDDEKLKAFASIVFNNAFVVKDLKVIEGNKGLFVAMPSRRGKDGTFRDIAHPLNQATRDMIERAVLEEYRKEVARGFEGVKPQNDGLDD